MGTKILFQPEVARAWGWPLTSTYSRGYEWVKFTPFTPTHVPSQHGQGQLYLSTQSQCKLNYCCSPVRWHLKSHWPVVNKAPCQEVWCSGGAVPHSEPEHLMRVAVTFISLATSLSQQVPTPTVLMPGWTSKMARWWDGKYVLRLAWTEL